MGHGKASVRTLDISAPRAVSPKVILWTCLGKVLGAPIVAGFLFDSSYLCDCLSDYVNGVALA